MQETFVIAEQLLRGPTRRTWSPAAACLPANGGQQHLFGHGDAVHGHCLQACKAAPGSQQCQASLSYSAPAHHGHQAEGLGARQHHQMTSHSRFRPAVAQTQA